MLRSGSADELCFASPAGRTSEPQSQGYSRYRSCCHEVVSRVSADSSLRGRVLLDHAPGKLAKRQTRLQNQPKPVLRSTPFSAVTIAEVLRKRGLVTVYGHVIPS